MHVEREAGVSRRQDIGSDGYAARFHAIKVSGTKELDMFIIVPIDDAFLPYLLAECL
jgi:hypothetical protein